MGVKTKSTKKEAAVWERYEAEKRVLRRRLENGEIDHFEYDRQIKSLCDKLGI